MQLKQQSNQDLYIAALEEEVGNLSFPALPSEKERTKRKISLRLRFGRYENLMR